MNARVLGAFMIGLVFGLSAGVAGLFLAARQGWLRGEAANTPHDAPAHAEDTDAHGGEEEHEAGREAVAIDETVMREFGIELASAGPETLRQTVTLPGEVEVNPDRLAHIVPRGSGIVREVRAELGDEIEAGQVMAVLESRELAEAKAAFLAAEQRLSLAKANLSANEELHAKGVVSDLEFLSARRELADAEIELRAADRKLHALGLDEQEIAAIEREPDAQFATYVLRAPFAGTVIEKHITLGETVGPDTSVFVLANLEDVWVMLTVYQKDLPAVRIGQPVTIHSSEGSLRARGRIDYLSATVDESTRTATARVVIANAERAWRPGLFVTGQVEVARLEVPVAVPLSAVVEFEGRPSVLVLTEHGFVPQAVELGRRDGQRVEIAAGLRPEQRYAARGAFALKAELLKASFAGGGHAH